MRSNDHGLLDQSESMRIMKRSTQIGMAICIAAIFGCGGESADNSGAGKNSSPRRNNVADQIANRTSIDDEPSRDGAPVRGQAPPSRGGVDEPKKEMAATSEPSGATAKDPNAFNSALFPAGIAGAGGIAGLEPGFGGALFPTGKSVASMVKSKGSDEQNADEQPGRGRIGALGGGASGREEPVGRGDPNSQVAGSGPGSNDASDVMEAKTEAKPATLLAQAKRRFVEHDEENGIKLLYAHHLVSDEARSDYSLNWFKGLKEPRLLLRLGVGIIYNAPKDFDGRHPVIGDPGDPNEGATASRNNNRSGRRGRGGLSATGSGGGSRGGSRTYKDVNTERPDGYLLYYTGEFGEAVVRELDKRRKSDDSSFGKILKDVMDVELPNDEEEPERAPSSRRSSAASSISSLGIGNSRGRGRQPVDDEPKDSTVLDGALGNGTAQKPDDEEFTGSIRPGVMLVGVGSKVELLERAKAAGLDSLITFNVKVTTSRRGSNPPTSTTSVKVLDLKTDNEQLFSGRSLKDTMVSEKQDEGEDLVEKEIERLFNVMDSDFAAAPLPSAISADNVKKRIGRLLKTHADNPLPAAVEVVAFLEQKLLTEDLAKTAMKRLFKTDDATVLITGGSDERLEFLSNWLPDGIAN